MTSPASIPEAVVTHLRGRVRAAWESGTGPGRLQNDPVPRPAEDTREGGVPRRIVDGPGERVPVRSEHSLERRVVHGEVTRAHDPRGPVPGRVEHENAPARVLGADGRPGLVDRADAAAAGVAAEERAGAGDRRRGKLAGLVGIDRDGGPLARVAVDNDAAAGGRVTLEGVDVAHGRAALAAAQAGEGHG